MFGNSTQVVGVEDELVDGALKVYVSHRSRGLYVLIDDEDAQRKVRNAWADQRTHVFIPLPPSGCLYQDDDMVVSDATEETT